MAKYDDIVGIGVNDSDWMDDDPTIEYMEGHVQMILMEIDDLQNKAAHLFVPKAYDAPPDPFRGPHNDIMNVQIGLATMRKSAE